jgi:hypothetical protein
MARAARSANRSGGPEDLSISPRGHGKTSPSARFPAPPDRLASSAPGEQGAGEPAAGIREAVRYLKESGDAAGAAALYNRAATRAGRPRISSVHPMSSGRWLLAFERGDIPWVYDIKNDYPHPLRRPA